MITLKGNFKTKQILINGMPLQAYANRLSEKKSNFDWGRKSHGCYILSASLLICLTGTYFGAMKLRESILLNLPKSNFEILFELDEEQLKLHNIRRIAIMEAHGYNKHLTEEYLKSLLNEELLCFIHPLSRDRFMQEANIK